MGPFFIQSMVWGSALHAVAVGAHEEQEAQHQHDAHRQSQQTGRAEVDQQAGHNVADAGDEGTGGGVGQLGCLLYTSRCV